MCFVSCCVFLRMCCLLACLIVFVYFRVTFLVGFGLLLLFLVLLVSWGSCFVVVAMCYDVVLFLLYIMECVVCLFLL